MKVLILHHVQSEWFSRGTEAEKEEYAEKVIDYIEDNDFDEIILTYWSGENVRKDYTFSYLHSLCTNIYEYDYCWWLDSLTENDEEYESLKNDLPDRIEAWNETFIKNNLNRHWGNECYSLVPDWINKYKGSEITLCGMFEGECLTDMETVLEYVGLEYTKEYNLIRGA